MERKIASITPMNEVVTPHTWACLIETASSVLCSIWDRFTIFDITYGTNCTVILFDVCTERGNDFALVVSPIRECPTRMTFRFTCKTCFRSTYQVSEIKNLCQHARIKTESET